MTKPRHALILVGKLGILKNKLAEISLESMVERIKLLF
jgi:hypothetical protein